MPKVHVSAFSISLDGFGAGPNQSLENPLGMNGPDMFDWFFKTRTWQQMHGEGDGETGVDDDFAAQAMTGNGAWIMGRNMFGPVRGPWPDEKWRGWWGEDPPYHVPTYVLTHHPREPIIMQGGTVFHFVTGGIHEALKLAKAAAGDKNVRIGGGVATIHKFLRARLLDELHLVLSPALLGKGEHFFHGIDFGELGYQCVKHVAGTRAVAHVVLQKQA